MINEQINFKLQDIDNDLDLLRTKHVYELEKVPGVPKCSTIANRIQENVEFIIESYEKKLAEKGEAADREQFDLLAGMLTRLASEIETLSKKQPDALVNRFKVGQINRVLVPLKEIMANEPSSEFLDLVAEVEENSAKSRNSYSDVAVILSQFREACGEYRSKHYNMSWSFNL